MSYYPSGMSYASGAGLPLSPRSSLARRFPMGGEARYNQAYHQQLLQLLNDSKHRLRLLGGHPQVLAVDQNLDQAINIIRQEMSRPMLESGLMR